ncbi:MAG TPA: primosomal protein N', partial [Rickettsiales bacterium]|nr:primosomal protein N' [Rickettsiales bacterium]
MYCFFDILLPLPLDRAFTYKDSNREIVVGDIVKVPFGRKNIWGLVVAKYTSITNSGKNIAPEKIKEITKKHDFLYFSEKTIDFIEKISSYNLATRGLVLKAFLGIINSDKVKSEKIIEKFLSQNIDAKKFILKKLSPKQQEISDEILRSNKSVSLIDAVTGSGKTEIYFAIIAKILQKKAGQILIMLPEITLTSQLVSRFEEQFGFKPALWHSKISIKEKRKIFHGIIKGEVRALIGARSSLLLPFKNLQLIIVDEEHDSSFKQDDIFNFNARDMAILKAKIEEFPVILSSATPSLESYQNAKSGKYNYFFLDDKFNQKTNDINIIDLRQNKLESGSYISGILRAEIAKNLENSHQTLLFLNRRGYAPVTLCKACGQKINCPNCSSYLVHHKHAKSAICHYCGHNEKFDHNCKFCGEENTIINIGVGVEKIKEEVESHFPKARIAMVDSDNVTNFKEAEKIVKQILKDEIDIIIGTQIIAKGYDFPHLTLVGIIDADSGFYSSDLKSGEKSFQLLSQVIGRAGRKNHGGRVFIQTYNPQNLIFEKIIQNDKKGFYDFEISNRKSLNLPPFCKMAKITISAFEQKIALNFAKNVIKNIPFNDAIEVFG